MEKAKKTTYSSLDELRADKKKVRDILVRSFKEAKRDSKDCFLPSDNVYLESSHNYMRYIGYAITMYKTFRTVNKISRFIATSFRK